MSREWQFNPPPNWPAPTQAPGLDWRPDPRWGPIPVGWELWRRRRTPSRRTRTSAVLTVLAALACAVAIQFSSLGPGTAPGVQLDRPQPAQDFVHPVRLSEQLAFRIRSVAGTGLYDRTDRVVSIDRTIGARP